MDGSGAVLSRAVSGDGTAIGIWTSGKGAPLVLVHGMGSDHTRWGPLLEHVEQFAQVHAMDRRGRGASGDGTSYDMALEFGDVAAVVDAVARRTGSPVDVYGHSLGATCALGGVALTGNIRRLVLYEPAVNASPDAQPAGFEDRLDALLAEGRPEAVVETFLRELLQLSDLQIQDVISLPSWPGRVSAAPTIPRELRAEAAMTAAVDPATAARITAPTLMLLGGDSLDWIKADTETVLAALPDARVALLEGQEHLADVAAPELVAGHLRAFLRGDG
jgi:pimeloyl-ACP methyl ester carboxylesterase